MGNRCFSKLCFCFSLGKEILRDISENANKFSEMMPSKIHFVLSSCDWLMILLFIFWVPFYPPLGARYIILLISLDYLWYKIRITLHSTYRVRILSGTMFFIFTFNVLSILGPRSVRSIWCCRCFSNEIRYQFVLCDKNIIIEVPIKLHCACWRFYMFLICILYLYWMSGGGHGHVFESLRW